MSQIARPGSAPDACANHTKTNFWSSVFHDEIFDIVLVTNDTDNHIMKSKNSVSHRLRKNLTAQSISE
jgi:hypothetical protein